MSRYCKHGVDPRNCYECPTTTFSPTKIIKTPQKTLNDYNYWLKPCQHCNYDGGKITSPKKGNNRCWKCGRPVQRDFSDRALKP